MRQNANSRRDYIGKRRSGRIAHKRIDDDYIPTHVYLLQRYPVPTRQGYRGRHRSSLRRTETFGDYKPKHAKLRHGLEEVA